MDKTHYRKAFNSPYLSSADIVEPTDLTISHVRLEPDKTDEKERELIVKNKIQKATQWVYKFSQGKPSAKGYISTENKYDEKGNLVEVINYKATGQISSKLLYKYDKNNNRVEYQKFGKTDKEELGLTYKQVFTYDEVGNKKVEVGFDGLTGYRITYSYLPEYKPKEIIKYNADNSISEKWEYSYNALS